MLAFLQYLIALVVASHDLPEPGRPGPEPQWLPIGLVVFGLGFVAALLGLALRARSRHHTLSAARIYDAVQGPSRLVVLGAFWLVAQPLGGRMIPAALGVDDWVLVGHLMRLLPFALLLGGMRIGLHPAGRALGVEPESIRSALGAEARDAILPLFPLVPVLTAWDVVIFAEPASRLGALRDVLLRLPVLQALVTLAALFVALLMMPFVLRVVWRAYPLPEGPLRKRLEAYAARVGLRSRGFLVWPTGGAVHNAAVIGPLPRFRYVILSDALLDDLGDDEIEAVVAHEAGHARRGHILLFFGFSAVLVLASVLPQALGTGIAAPLLALDPLVRTVILLFIWIGVVFGWVSRRFEQEADVYGIDTLPSARDAASAKPEDHPFARALEKIAEEAGGMREVTGWRHFSVADRVDFVRRYLTDDAVRASYRRSIGLLRGVLLSVIGGVTFLAAIRIPGEIQAAGPLWAASRDPAAQLLRPLHTSMQPLPVQLRAITLVQAADLAGRAGKPDEQLRWLREAAALVPTEPEILARYARALAEAGRPRGSELAWRELLALDDAPDHLQDAARDALARVTAPQGE